VIELSDAVETGGHCHLGDRKVCFGEQRRGEVDPSYTCDRRRCGTKMLREQPP
jgi:hypothetical protein